MALQNKQWAAWEIATKREMGMGLGVGGRWQESPTGRAEQLVI